MHFRPSRLELPMHRFRHLFAVALAAVLLVVPAARSMSTDMVVSQLFAGGGNANAPYANDYVELFNRGASPVAVNSATKSNPPPAASGTMNRIGRTG